MYSREQDDAVNIAELAMAESQPFSKLITSFQSDMEVALCLTICASLAPTAINIRDQKSP